MESKNLSPQAISRVRQRAKLASRIAEYILLAAASSSVVITIAIVATLIFESLGFFRHVSLSEFLFTTEWSPSVTDESGQGKFGVLPLVTGTLITTIVALSVAIPVGTTCAIWLSEYCPHKLREILKPALELLAAVPTVVFGYFALLFVGPLVQKLVPGVQGPNMLSAGLVMGVMIIPYIASLSEDAMKAVPSYLREGAYALGATRVQVAIHVVYPAAFSGITAAYILAVSRALGETMIVAVAAGLQAKFTFDPRQPAQTLTSFIAVQSGGDVAHADIEYQSIFAVGLTLVVLTLFFNVVGHRLRTKYREAY